jgi:hypothetical protein
MRHALAPYVHPPADDLCFGPHEFPIRTGERESADACVGGPADESTSDVIKVDDDRISANRV